MIMDLEGSGRNLLELLCQSLSAGTKEHHTRSGRDSNPENSEYKQSVSATAYCSVVHRKWSLALPSPQWRRLSTDVEERCERCVT
jgi:hypothetical protein